MNDEPSVPDKAPEVETNQPKAGLKLLPLVALLIFLAGIAHFSNQPAREQDLKPWLNQYPRLIKAVQGLPHIQLNYEGHIENNYKNPASFIQFCLRKTVHFTMYGTLGLLVLFNLRGLGLRDKRLYVGAALILLLVAGLDEWHQLTVPGRMGLYYDVIVDFLGFTIFALIARKRFSAS
ncbi:MAG: VanZ family protein [Syntrophomonas sp.]